MLDWATFYGILGAAVLVIAALSTSRPAKTMALVLVLLWGASKVCNPPLSTVEGLMVRPFLHSIGAWVSLGILIWTDWRGCPRLLISAFLASLVIDLGFVWLANPYELAHRWCYKAALNALYVFELMCVLWDSREHAWTGRIHHWINHLRSGWSLACEAAIWR